MVGGSGVTCAVSQTLTSLVGCAIGTTIPESLRGAHGASAITSVDALRLKTPAEDPATSALRLPVFMGLMSVCSVSLVWPHSNCLIRVQS